MEIGLVSILRSAWIAAIMPILLASVPCARLSSFHRVVLTFASRGKIVQSSSRKFTVPQRFFLHFYVVAVAVTTVLLLMTWFYAYWMVPFSSESFHFSTVASHLTGGSHILSMHKSLPTPEEHRYRLCKTLFLLLLMEVQVLRRLYETVDVFSYSPSARMHIFGYLTGLYFYAAAPLSFCCICAPEVFSFAAHQVVEFILKGRDRMPNIEFDWWGYVKPLTKLGWCQWIGATIFIWGWIHQSHCHSILGSLREHSEKTDEYVIPHGDWFEFVSCPHYLSEIVIYAGLLVASGGSDLTIWLLFIFVVANLTFAAAETHRWYSQNFDNYPRNRHAIIPYIY
ncbi:polyprenol reductase 2-like [Telopea speciosissima]|uniref:polyprenol reductase 2-like n=1 Tax=Telopea speciosissima TaxID=54955 RepID=UPI001CC3721B|nr:polyprenol reductase 2-like [Telopea speciosissima]